MHVRARQRERQARSLLVREKANGLGDLEALRERDHLTVPSAEACDHDPQVVSVAKERRSAHEAVEILRVPDVARVHDDEPADEAVLPRPLVVPRLRRDRAGVDPVRDHAEPLGRSALGLEPLAHRLADRDDPVGAPQVGADEASQDADHGRIAEPVELRRDLREHVLADDEHGRADALPDEHAEIADDRRVGHAQHEVGRRPAQRVAEAPSRDTRRSSRPFVRAPSARTTSMRRA